MSTQIDVGYEWREIDKKVDEPMPGDMVLQGKDWWTPRFDPSRSFCVDDTYRRRIPPGEGYEIVPEEEAKAVPRRIKAGLRLPYYPEWEAWKTGEWHVVWNWCEFERGEIRAFRRRKTPIQRQQPAYYGVCEQCRAYKQMQPGGRVCLECEPDPRREWIPRSVRMPREGDGNSMGKVLWWSPEYTYSICNWAHSMLKDWTHWQTLSEPPPKPEPEWKTACRDYIAQNGVADTIEDTIDAWFAGAKWAKANPDKLEEL